jgi:tetratricopeptide (TPR) repeat protein
MGRYPEALADFDRALVLDPGNAWVSARRGETLRLLGRYEEAMADFDRVLDLHPDDDLARCRRALVLRQQGRAGEAEAELRLAAAAAATRLAERPGDARLLFRLGLCHAAAGDFAEARRRCREALVHGARPEQVHGTVADLIDLRQVAPARELDALIALLQSADVVPD